MDGMTERVRTMNFEDETGGELRFHDLGERTCSPMRPFSCHEVILYSNKLRLAKFRSWAAYSYIMLHINMLRAESSLLSASWY